MICSMETICRKEVINICTGARIGYVCDAEIDTDCARIEALLVLPCGGFSIFKRKEPLRICWNCIQVIGAETVLVRCEQPLEECKREKPKWLSSIFSK